jgi:acyl-CoA dehydrogenase
MNPAIDFSLSPDVERIRQKVRTFVAENCLPLEADRANFDDHENISMDVLEKLRRKAKDAGLWAPQISESLGGMGLSMTAQAVVYEEAAYSIFGPLAINCSAPDDGNMRLLMMVGTDDQKERWLKPIVDGRVRSSFVMTEPHPGSGSDPAGMMLTKAEKKGNSWVIKGRKWFITGAGVAEHFIIIARTSDDPRNGLSAFIFHRDQPGWRITRKIPIMGPEEHGGHCELEFDGLEIPERDVLMNIGDGMRATQIRLGPARLTHCMRWLGMSRRAMDIAADYVRVRKSFGDVLADHEGVQWILGDAAMDIHMGRLATMFAAWKLDQGGRARKEISMAKVQVADTLNRVVDSCIQLCGAKGYSQDTLLEWMYRYARQAKLVDGASEVHKMVLSRLYMKEGQDFWSWDASD